MSCSKQSANFPILDLPLVVLYQTLNSSGLSLFDRISVGCSCRRLRQLLDWSRPESLRINISQNERECFLNGKFIPSNKWPVAVSAIVSNARIGQISIQQTSNEPHALLPVLNALVSHPNGLRIELFEFDRGEAEDYLSISVYICDFLLLSPKLSTLRLTGKLQLDTTAAGRLRAALEHKTLADCKMDARPAGFWNEQMAQELLTSFQGDALRCVELEHFMNGNRIGPLLNGWSGLTKLTINYGVHSNNHLLMLARLPGFLPALAEIRVTLETRSDQVTLNGPLLVTFVNTFFTETQKVPPQPIEMCLDTKAVLHICVVGQAISAAYPDVQFIEDYVRYKADDYCVYGLFVLQRPNGKLEVKAAEFSQCEQLCPVCPTFVPHVAFQVWLAEQVLKVPAVPDCFLTPCRVGRLEAALPGYEGVHLYDAQRYAIVGQHQTSYIPKNLCPAQNQCPTCAQHNVGNV